MDFIYGVLFIVGAFLFIIDYALLKYNTRFNI